MTMCHVNIGIFKRVIMELATSTMYVETVDFLRGHLPEDLRSPSIAIICGSGLGLLAEAVEQNDALSKSFEYASVPHFLQSTGKEFLIPPIRLRLSSSMNT